MGLATEKLVRYLGSWGQDTINPTPLEVTAWLRAQIQQRSAPFAAPNCHDCLTNSSSYQQWQDVEEDIDPNKLGALAMEAMLSWDLSFSPNRIEALSWTSSWKASLLCSFTKVPLYITHIYIYIYIYIYSIYNILYIMYIWLSKSDSCMFPLKLHVCPLAFFSPRGCFNGSAAFLVLVLSSRLRCFCSQGDFLWTFIWLRPWIFTCLGLRPTSSSLLGAPSGRSSSCSAVRVLAWSLGGPALTYSSKSLIDFVVRWIFFLRGLIGWNEGWELVSVGLFKLDSGQGRLLRHAPLIGELIWLRYATVQIPDTYRWTSRSLPMPMPPTATPHFWWSAFLKKSGKEELPKMFLPSPFALAMETFCFVFQKECFRKKPSLRLSAVIMMGFWGLLSL